jgi:hypothetical protein
MLFLPQVLGAFPGEAISPPAPLNLVKLGVEKYKNVSSLPLRFTYFPKVRALRAEGPW